MLDAQVQDGGPKGIHKPAIIDSRSASIVSRNKNKTRRKAVSPQHKAVVTSSFTETSYASSLLTSRGGSDEPRPVDARGFGTSRSTFGCGFSVFVIEVMTVATPTWTPKVRKQMAQSLQNKQNNRPYCYILLGSKQFLTKSLPGKVSDWLGASWGVDLRWRLGLGPKCPRSGSKAQACAFWHTWTSKRCKMMAWTPKACRMMACWALFGGWGLLIYLDRDSPAYPYSRKRACCIFCEPNRKDCCGVYKITEDKQLLGTMTWILYIDCNYAIYSKKATHAVHPQAPLSSILTRSYTHNVQVRTLVPLTSKGMAFGTRVLKYWVLGPSGISNQKPGVLSARAVPLHGLTLGRRRGKHVKRHPRKLSYFETWLILEAQQKEILESQWPIILGYFGSFKGLLWDIVACCFRLPGFPG